MEEFEREHVGTDTFWKTGSSFFVFRWGFLNNQTIPLSEKKKKTGETGAIILTWNTSFFLKTVAMVGSLSVFGSLMVLRALWPFAANLALCSPSCSHSSSQRLQGLYGNIRQMCVCFRRAFR